MSYVNKVRKNENVHNIQDARLPDPNPASDVNKIIKVDSQGDYVLGDTSSTLNIDANPTLNSDNLVKSGGVYAAIN